MVQCPASAVSCAACAACFSLRARFRVCHDLCSVFGFGFSFLCDSRLGGVVVFAIYPLSIFQCYVSGTRVRPKRLQCSRPFRLRPYFVTWVVIGWSFGYTKVAINRVVTLPLFMPSWTLPGSTENVSPTL